MKKYFVKLLCLALCLTLVAVVAVAAETPGVMPRLTGIDLQTANLEINDYGRAGCGCSVLAKTGYSVEVTMALEQDGHEIKTWTGSGSRVDLGKTYYVTEGHDYQVVATTKVKTSGGLYLLSYTIGSQIVHY